MRKIGDNYYDSDEFREFLAEYEKAKEAGEPVFLDADELSEIADYYQLANRFDDADEAIEMALSLSPGAVAPLTYRIHEAIWEGDLEKAKEYLEQIVEKDEPDYVYDKVEIMLAEELVEEADTYLKEEYKKVPPYERHDFVVDVANIFADYDYPEHAMQWMSRSKPEETPEFKELLARTLFGLGKYRDSEKLWGELIDTDPFSKHYWNSLASAQLMNDDFSGAIESSEFAIAIDPEDAEALFSKANALNRLGNYEESLKYFERYCALVPDDELALLHRGTCLLNLGRTDEAIDMLKQTAQMVEHRLLENEEDVSPYIADIYQELAFAYAEKGKPKRALHALDEADRFTDDHAQTMLVRGHIMMQSADIDKGMKFYKEAIKRSKEPKKTTMRVIVSIYDNHYVSTAYTLFRDVYFNPPGIVLDEGYAYMALCCYELKKYDEFMQYLKQACERCPGECKLALGHLFPTDIEPKEYYQYLQNRMKK